MSREGKPWLPANLIVPHLTSNFQNYRFRLGKRVAEFNQFNWLHLIKGFEQLRLNDPVMTNQKFCIGHILRIIATHHFGKHQINSGRSV